MVSITQDMRFRLSIVKYARNHGVISAAIKYRKNRQYVYRWLKRYDGGMATLFRTKIYRFCALNSFGLR